MVERPKRQRTAAYGSSVTQTRTKDEMRHTNLPHHFYVQVDNQFLGSNMPAGTTPGMWHAIYARPGQYLSCHVILASGAHCQQPNRLTLTLLTPRSTLIT